MRTLLAVMIGIVVFMPQIKSQEWTFVNAGEGIKPSIEINSSGQALIAFLNEDVTSGFVNLSTVQNDSPTTQLVEDGYFYGPAWIALDSNEDPRILYHDHDSQSANLASFSGASWTVDTIVSPNHDGWDGSLFIDANDDNHILSVDPVSGVEYALPGQSSWTIEIADSSATMYRFGTDIELDAQGNVHIAYYRLASGKLYYGLKSNGNWTIEEVADNGLFPSLELLDDGSVVIAYYQPEVSQDEFELFGSVRLASNASGPWTSTFVDSLDNVDATNDAVSTTGARNLVSLVRDANNDLHLAYSNKDLVKYGIHNGTTWTLETVIDETNTATTLGQMTSLAIASDGSSHLAYYEAGGNPEGGEIIYAHRDAVVQAPMVTISCPEDVQIFCDADSGPLGTGSATTDPDTADLSFSDTMIQSCPENEIIQRTWIAFTQDSLSSDTCVQLITIVYNGLSTSSLLQASINADSLCLEDISTIYNDSINLGCGVTLDTIVTTLDSIDCFTASYTRNFTLIDECLDSSIVLSQSITIETYTFVSIDNVTVAADSGDNSGSISFDISCASDSLSYAWSNGSTDASISSLEAGEYTVTITNELGCEAAFDFLVEFEGVVSTFICPPDTIIPCSVLITPMFTGELVVEGYFNIDFEDNIIQNCPDDIIVERFWFGTKDSINYDTCLQIITVVVDPFELITISDTLFLDNICLEDIDELVQVDLDLPCNLGIDSIKVTVDTAICELFNIRAVYFLGDECRDTFFNVSQTIIITNPIVLSLDNVTVMADTTNSSGSISFQTSCVLSPVTYQWSDNSTDSTRTNLNAGPYALTVTNGEGCTSVFNFLVPFSPTDFIICPPDTSVACGDPADPMSTGSPSTIAIDTSVDPGVIEYDFTDLVIQDCPDDQIIQRTWYVSLDSVLIDSCSQLITIVQDDLAAISFNDSLTYTNICIDSLMFLPADAISLGCNHQIDTTFLLVDTILCDAAQMRRIWQITDECRDTSIEISQFILVEDLKVFELEDIQITGDKGDSSGMISLSFSCVFDSLSYSWSDGSMSPSLTMASAGDYSLTVTNGLGCVDSISFTVPFVDPTTLECPPDTTISCTDDTSPENTGTAQIVGFTSLAFADSILQDCPDDRIIQRTWIASLDSTDSDTCIQLITVTQSDFSGISVADSVSVSGICLDDVIAELEDSISLGCNQVVDTAFYVIDTVGCGFASITRTWQIIDVCQDDTLTLLQNVAVNDLPVAQLNELSITADSGDSSGSISLDIGCVFDSLSYAWSDGSSEASLTMASAGDYSLTITNGLGCVDSFSFTVPFIDPTTLECPPDTTISCTDDTSPENTGTAQIAGFTSLTFADSILQDCPDDRIIQRTWIASLDSTDSDTCIQLITVTQSDFSGISVADSVSVSGICLDDVIAELEDSISLGCNQVVDTAFYVIDTVGCGFASITRTWQIIDVCQDDTLTLLQYVAVNDLPVAQLNELSITADSGDSSGSISLDIGCVFDSLSYAWSDGSSEASLTMASAGDYSLTVTNGLGCVDSFSFTVPFVDPTTLTCPPDTTISCTDDTSPENTGTAQIAGFTSLTFADSILQDCPDDRIIQRTWIASLDSTDSDTCIQLITVTQSDFSGISVADSVSVSGICLDDVIAELEDSISLGCNQVVDTAFYVIDTVGCGFASITRTWQIIDVCQDDTLTLLQNVAVNDLPVAQLNELSITGDSGDSSGSISLDIGCVFDSLSYAWSDGSSEASLTMASAGDYSLTVTNGIGCVDSFSFTVPFIDTTTLECPPDTTISCTDDTSPENTGTAQIAGFNSLTFADSILQDCPDDRIIQRTWIASLDSTDSDTCIQLITVTQSDFSGISVADSVSVSGICLDDVIAELEDSISLGCNQVVDTAFYVIDTVGCGFASITRTWQIIDICKDDTLTLLQNVAVNDLPVAQLNELSITADSGDSSGSISLDIGCVFDSLSYAWSDGSSEASLTMASAGDYSLTVTNGLGCVDSFSFTVPFVDNTTLECPPDTTINCTDDTSPANTGMAEISGFTELTFTDSIIQDCPDDIVIQRTWMASLDSSDTESCTQIITVISDGLAAIVTPDSLSFSQICLSDISNFISDSISLGCNQTVDTTFINRDTLGCGFAQLTRTWVITDNCLDSTVMVHQVYTITDLPVVLLGNIQVQGDPGDSSGSISFFVTCFADTLSYLWSDSSTMPGLTGLSAGQYSLTITNGVGCSDSYDFTIPVLDTTTLTCPPDTVISCLDGIDPSNTGIAQISGFNSLTFSDSIIQDCPEDQIILRTWVASLDSLDSDTCIQQITVTNTDPGIISIMDTLSVSGICIEDISDDLADEIVLGCNQSIDTSFISIDTLGCGFAGVQRTWNVIDECFDTTLVIVQYIQITDLPVARIDNANITGDVGDSSGSIVLEISCNTDTLSYSWSNGSSGDGLEMAPSGDYGLTITNGLGCVDSFFFTIPELDTTTLICPPDTTISCTDPTTPDFTGTASIMGFTQVTFSDQIIQDCPDDMVIQRTWMASLDSIDADSCIQLITVEAAGLSAIVQPDSLLFTGECADDLSTLLMDSIILGCNQVIDSTFISVDTMGCGFMDLTRTWIIRDMCLDTIINLQQNISLLEIPVAVLDNVNIIGDIGDTTGSISFGITCPMDSLTFAWSNGSNEQNQQLLSAGDYNLTISNSMGCLDSFAFTVPFIDTSTTLFSVNLTDRDDAPLAVDRIQFLDFNQQEIISDLRNSAVGNYDYGIRGSLDDLAYVCPFRDVEPAIADITVLDLIRGQRYILGLSEGCSEDGIAGDVNFSGDISGADLVLMRRVMLGLDLAFPDSITWQFISVDTVQSQVIQVPGCIQITDENRAAQSAILKGIKLGDYKCSE